ncbi:MAG: HlyD family type I secretion periplasmic adaptor subunit [Spirochaetales bacterium]|nr:HlyD family type I secretion periplasmic adaptor subunit [Spirochaetales bacterium]
MRTHRSMFRERAVMPHHRPSPVRSVGWLATASILSLLVWSFVARIPEIARTRGQVDPRGASSLVQSLEGGQIVDILIREGQLVDKGQPLVRFEPLRTETDINQLESRMVFLTLEAERLKAYVEERAPDFSQYKDAYPLFVEQQNDILSAQRAELRSEIRVWDEQLEQKRQSLDAFRKKQPVLEQQLASAVEMTGIFSDLHKKGIATRVELINAQQRVSEFQKELEEHRGMRGVVSKEIAEIKESRERATLNKFADAQNQRAKTLAELAEIKQRLNERQTSLQRLVIVSPTKGVVKKLPFTTTGAVVNPSEIIAEIIPLDVDLIVQVQVSPRDIGFVQAGMPVNIRIDTYDYSRYGVLAGTLTRLSPSTFTGDRGELYYVGEVTPEKLYLGNDPEKCLLLPGMTAEVDIITGEKTIFEYLLKPVLTLTSRGFSER